jgi:3-oxoacyl-(acyl-carrier-protein) synthase
VNRWLSDAETAPGEPSIQAGSLRDWEFDWRKHKIPPKQLACANPLQFMILDAARQALDDCGFDPQRVDRRRVAAVVGTLFTSDFSVDTFLSVRVPELRDRLEEVLAAEGLDAATTDRILETYAEALRSANRAAQDESASYNSSTLASRISKAYDLMGGAFAVDAGDASGLAALKAAADLIEEGRCDLVLCAAGQRTLDEINRMNSTTPPGEGAVVLVLKPLEAARRDGDTIHAEIRDIASVSSAGSSAAALDATTDQLASSESSAAIPIEPHTTGGLDRQFGHLGAAAPAAALIADILQGDEERPRTLSALNTRGFGTEGGSAWSMLFSRPTRGTADFERTAIDLMVQRSGIPRDIADLDVDIRADLHWNAADLEAFLDDLRRLPGVNGSKITMPHPGQPATLREVLRGVSLEGREF